MLFDPSVLAICANGRHCTQFVVITSIDKSVVVQGMKVEVATVPIFEKNLETLHLVSGRKEGD